ncbi:MAG TPA: capsule assembly Wzi family protein [Candidatus Eisenbacteria bacterium]|nr:capsule assembly Wzi family protein [Candidatus Eisenbacteria bacterium]
MRFRRLVELLFVATAVAVAAVATAAAPAAAATLPYIPLDHWTTPLLTEAAGRGLLPGVSLADRPFRRADVERALREERAEAEISQREYTPFESWLLTRLESEFDPNEPPPAPAFARLTQDWTVGYGLEARGFAYAGDDHRRFGMADGKGIALPFVGFQSGRGLAAGVRFRVDSDGERVPDFNGRAWRNGRTGDAKNAYALLQLGAADILLGRDDLRWGASENGTLLLSAYAPAMDQAGLRLRLGPVTASSFFGNLDDMTLTAPTAQAPGDTLPAGTVIQRRITGHRVRWQVNRYIAVGAAEVVVYGGKDRAAEAEYLIPVSVFYATQWNSGKNDNILGAFTLELRPKNDMELYGELLVDDFQIDNKSAADQEPFEGGFLVGQRLYNPLGLDGSMFRVEWARVEPFTFNQTLPWNRYLYKDQPLGFPLGPDAQSLNLEFRYWMSEQVTWTFRYAREERGATRVNDPWPVPVSGPTDATPFPEFDHVPTGVVEARSRIGTEFWIHPKPGIDLRLSGGYLDIQNAENVRDADRSEWFFEGALSLTWSRMVSPGR